ncbi:MAG TPA: PPC domain-containing protein [Planctomycetota bacterium]|nr:PPC domain-containing protein [Planctomycetota bacterium]
MTARTILILLLLSSTGIRAEEKKDEKKKEPQVVLAVPPAVIAGTKTAVTIRGLNLDKITEIKFTESTVKAEIKAKGKADIPKPLDAPQAGDTKVDIDLEVPAGAPPGPLTFTLAAAEGTTKAHSLIVFAPGTLVAESEPNNAYRTAPEFPLGKTVLGTIQDSNDVDVYRIEAKAGQLIVARVAAQAVKSNVDATLTLIDARGTPLSVSDDTESGRDPALRQALPADGIYYLVLQDAHARGGPTHNYLLTAQLEAATSSVKP